MEKSIFPEIKILPTFKDVGHVILRLLYQLPPVPFAGPTHRFGHYDEDLLASPIEPVTELSEPVYEAPGSYYFRGDNDRPRNTEH